VLSEEEKDKLVAHYRKQVRGLVAGRPWIAVKGVLVSAANEARLLHELGASRVLAIGASRGTGKVPDPDELLQLDLGLRGRDMMTSIRKADALFSQLPEAATSAIEAFDPERIALVTAEIFGSGRPVAGRPVWGARPQNWQDLEDKMIVDELWDDAGVDRAPSRIVPASADTMLAAAEELDVGLGTVWVGDNREGWHGGATMLRWVRDQKDAAEASAFFAESCDRIRIMPFLEGIPCSIHGWVFPGCTIAFRPCEMLVFRVPGSTKLFYGGAATLWEPSSAVTHAMRSVAQRVGEHLRNEVSYRGAFTVDGVVSTHGFRPTELNPRFGAALGRMSSSLPDLPLLLLHLATIEEAPLDFRPRDLEKLILQATVQDPAVKAMQVIAGKFALELEEIEIVSDGSGEYRLAVEGEESHGRLRVGPASAGAVCFAILDAEYLEPRVSPAPQVLAAFRLADRVWGLELPDLRPAVDVEPARL
jgi:hypothetical protein